MDFINSLTATNWIAFAALLVAMAAATFAGLNYFAGRRERRLKSFEFTPLIKAVINRQSYPGGWRSVNLHVVQKPGTEQTFKYASWRIERAKLLRPWNAKLAPAEMATTREAYSTRTVLRA
jgi:hypothetical protein